MQRMGAVATTMVAIRTVSAGGILSIAVPTVARSETIALSISSRSVYLSLKQKKHFQISNNVLPAITIQKLHFLFATIKSCHGNVLSTGPTADRPIVRL